MSCSLSCWSTCWYFQLLVELFVVELLVDKARPAITGWLLNHLPTTSNPARLNTPPPWFIVIVRITSSTRNPLESSCGRQSTLKPSIVCSYSALSLEAKTKHLHLKIADAPQGWVLVCPYLQHLSMYPDVVFPAFFVGSPLWQGLTVLYSWIPNSRVACHRSPLAIYLMRISAVIWRC